MIADNGIMRVLYYTGRFEKRVRALVPNLYDANKGRRRHTSVVVLPRRLWERPSSPHRRRRLPFSANRLTVWKPPSSTSSVVGCLQACSGRVRPISLTLTRSSCRPAKFTARVHRHNIFLFIYLFIKSVGRLSLPTLTPYQWPQSQISMDRVRNYQ